ncbi:MAG: dTDP-glucose 4,6-dehydratase [Gammaproteobacteria bacterium]|nr:dTDP-glucose 4,6-dehydratase [Gammaproteobacteria bacterium]
MTILVTGGAGFIGANFVLDWIRSTDEPIVNMDKLTYAGNLGSLSSIADKAQHHFVHGDICDSSLLASILREHTPRAVIHFAAESHVDRSIHGPDSFVQTNIVGTFRLLEATRRYWGELGDDDRSGFRFIQVSTDEVYGALGLEDPPFDEMSRYSPSSPYSASKAAADHLARSYFHTYDFPVITTNCSNNYGPYQFPEKLIPLMIINGLRGDSLPIYGDGKNVRDWLYVGDHCQAIQTVLAKGEVGATYNIGGRCEMSNVGTVEAVCSLLDEMSPNAELTSHRELMSFVDDRPGHDFRYAVDTGKIEGSLGWHPTESFDSGLRKTVSWYLDNSDWIAEVVSGEYRSWIDMNYRSRASIK